MFFFYSAISSEAKLTKAKKESIFMKTRRNNIVNISCDVNTFLAKMMDTPGI